jgi:putative hydrolase of HD superfamily
MESLLRFLFEVNKLKETVRTGWIIWRVKNPETIAEHIFRVSFLSYCLGWKKGLNLKRTIQCAISHDLCEVYAGDATPLFYYENLDVRKKKDREILMKGIRLSKEEKERMSKIKFENERKSLLKLIRPLKEDLRHEIFFRWLDYEKGFSAEGRFTRQVDWIENLIQSLEYLGPKKSGRGWWEIAEEKVFDPLLLEFLKVIQIKFYSQKNSKKSEKGLKGILEFILKIGKLKRMERAYWKAWGIKKAESVAEHIFSTTLLSWIFGRERKHLNQAKLLKMALSHEISAAIIGDTIPYIEKLPSQPKKRKEILKKWPRLPEDEKAKRFLNQYEKEKKAMEKLTSTLEPELKKEIIDLWNEYRRVSSAEALFLNQINVLAVLIQGIIYHKKYKINIAPLFEWAFEKCDDPILLSFLEKLAKL